MVAIPILLFIIWRIVTLGVYDSEHILRELEQHLIDDYRQSLYSQYGMYNQNAAESELAKKFPSEELADLEVSLHNVSMSAPLFSWSAKENVGIRFDYQLHKEGVVKQQKAKVYMIVDRQITLKFWQGNAFSYYLQYL